jgi:UTP--glucose-1-phosphate uridylyltransferase
VPAFDSSTFDLSVLDAHRQRMLDAGLSEVAILGHLRALRFVIEEGDTMIPEASIEPVSSLPFLSGLEKYADAGREVLERTAVIKLNGGLGTGMGLSGAKSLLAVRSGETFLDLIAAQALALRRRTGTAIPIVLMNSARTRQDSLAVLAKYPELVGPVPLDFLQHKVPRVDLETGAPVEWPDAPHLEWCPPGHGDLYAALQSSGMLDCLRDQGIRYAFVSNADNLGGVLDPSILGWLADEGLPFVMEVARRTVADKKGGHLAVRQGRLTLRESAQCPESDRHFFQDIKRHHFFNTNNLWLDLEALARVSVEGFDLPVIQNEKAVDPNTSDGPRCLQLESAMGSAVACFDGAKAICVPRDRFCPVKSTNDLLVIGSDAYQKTGEGRIQAVNPEAELSREVVLDPRFYGLLDDFRFRFPSGAPSLRECRRLEVVGDFRFGKGVRLVGNVYLENNGEEAEFIPDGARIVGEV